MKAAVLHGVGQSLRVEDVDVADPIGHEVLIRVAAVGVCRSDLHHVEGLYPTDLPSVLGHESAGVVEAVGDQARVCALRLPGTISAGMTDNVRGIVFHHGDVGGEPPVSDRIRRAFREDRP